MAESLLLTATRFEQEELAEQLEESVRQDLVDCWGLRGRLGHWDVWLVATGLGAVNAAHALTCALQLRRPALVLQIGVGGAYPGAGLAVGDIAVASEEYYGDLGVRTLEGWQSAEAIGIPVLEQDGERFFNRFPLPSEQVASAVGILRQIDWEGGSAKVRAGPFVTVQECSGTISLGVEREARFQAICENMEGAAAAHLCRLYRVPFLEVRGISNRVDDRQKEAWNLKLAASRAQRAGLALLRHWEG